MMMISIAGSSIRSRTGCRSDALAFDRKLPFILHHVFDIYVSRLGNTSHKKTVFLMPITMKVMMKITMTIYFDSADDDDDRKLLFIPVDTYYDQPGDGLIVSSMKGAKSIKVQN